MLCNGCAEDNVSGGGEVGELLGRMQGMGVLGGYTYRGPAARRTNDQDERQTRREQDAKRTML